MRLVVLIIGLLLGLLMFLQTFLVNVLGQAARDKATEQAGTVGVAAAVLWLLACAFVMPWPLVSVGSFFLAASLSFSVSGDFPDQLYCGIVALILAAFSFLGWRGKVQDRRTKAAEQARQAERDARYEALLTAQAYQRQDAPCPACGQLNPAGVRFCGRCGTKLGAYGPQPGFA